MPKRFQLIADHPALDFANTLDNRYEPAKSIELLESVQDLAQFGFESGLISAAEARGMGQTTKKHNGEKVPRSGRELREAIERIFAAIADGGRVASADLDVLNAWARRASAHRSIEKRNTSFSWTWEETANSAEGLLWRVAHAAAELLTSPELSSVRRCNADNCRWLFLDRSKNHSRRWCDMNVCGNRQKARAYYQRLAASS